MRTEERKAQREEMGVELSVFRRDGGVGGLMACGEKNGRKVVRRGDGR